MQAQDLFPPVLEALDDVGLVVPVQVVKTGLTPLLVTAEHMWVSEKEQCRHGEPLHTPQ